MNRDIVVTTSSSLEGWDIQKQLGVVTTHVVAGTNVFSDVFASWRDFFGGQSKSYQKQLSWINDSAIKRLKEDANRRGANAIIALKIDHDEISGDGKSMFMVTVSGTAVKANPPKNADSETEVDDIQEIGYEELNELIEVEQIISRLKEKIKQEDWRVFGDQKFELLMKHQISEAIPLILELMNHKKDRLLNEEWEEKLTEVCHTIDPTTLKETLYGELQNTPTGLKKKYVLRLIKNLQLVDYEEVKKLLQQNELQHQKNGLEVLSYDKTTYSRSDIDKLNELKDQIQSFEKKSKIVEVESTFTSKKQKVWECLCGKQNSMGNNHCKSCGRRCVN